VIVDEECCYERSREFFFFRPDNWRSHWEVWGYVAPTFWKYGSHRLSVNLYKSFLFT